MADLDRATAAALRRSPPPEALEWAARAIGDSAEVVRVRALPGAWSSAVHALDIRAAGGGDHRLVLRRHVRADFLAEEPDVAEREARVLQLLARSAVSAPELVAVDAAGEHCDVPAVLMTRLRGRPDAVPGDLDEWLHGLAGQLTAIHAVAVGETPVQAYYTYNDVDALEPPSWTREPEAWAAVIALARGPAPEAPNCFIHRDYHPWNVLWWRGRVSAVVDWVNASIGAPHHDAAHCRIALAADQCVEVAERFRAHVEALDGVPHDPYWDALAFANVLPKGWPGSDKPGVRERMDEYAVSVARR